MHDDTALPPGRHAQARQDRATPGFASAEPPTPHGRIAHERYPAPIRILHWLVVALVVVQVISSMAMAAWFEGARAENPAAPLSPGALVHAATGTAVLLLMAARFLVRLAYGTPPAPGDLPGWLRTVSRLNHFAFYLLLVALPITGVASAFFVPALATTHVVLTRALYGVLALHVAAVVWHMLVLRDGLLWRMLGR